MKMNISKLAPTVTLVDGQGELGRENLKYAKNNIADANDWTGAWTKIDSPANTLVSVNPTSGAKAQEIELQTRYLGFKVDEHQLDGATDVYVKTPLDHETSGSTPFFVEFVGILHANTFTQEAEIPLDWTYANSTRYPLVDLVFADKNYLNFRIKMPADNVEVANVWSKAINRTRAHNNYLIFRVQRLGVNFTKII